MISLLTRSVWRDASKHPAQLGLCILGVALSVAVVVSVDVATQSAERGFELTRSTLGGRASHHILAGSGGGLPESLYTKLRLAGTLIPMAPLVEGYVTGPDGQTLQLLGVDPYVEGPFRSYAAVEGDDSRWEGFLTEARGVVVSQELAVSLGGAVGDVLPMQVSGVTQDVKIMGILDPQDSLSRVALRNLVLCDIAVAQRILGRFGVLDRIDCIVKPDSPEFESLRSQLPEGVTLEPAGTTAKTLTEMTRAFRLNLSALSGLALVVGLFLIYNTMTFAVIRRRTWMGMLRALGVSRKQVFGLILAEALVIGICGTSLGIVVGLFLSQSLVTMVTQTVNDLYFVLTVSDHSIDLRSLGVAAALGIGGALLAAFRPAYEAMRRPPRDVLQRSAVEDQAALRGRAGLWFGLTLIAMACGLLQIDRHGLVTGFAAMFAFIVGGALLVPAAVVAISRMFQRAFSFGVMGLTTRMALRGVRASLSRTGVAIAALMVSVSMVVGVGVMIESFRATVVQWLEGTLQADLYVSPPPRMANRNLETMNEAVRDDLSKLEGLSGISTYRGVELSDDSGPLLMAVHELDPRGFEAFQFLDGDADIWASWERGDTVLISESLGFRRRLGKGDTIALPSEDGWLERPIAGVFYDYGADTGKVVISRTLYRDHWRDPSITSLGLYLNGRVPLSEFVESVHRTAAGRQTLVTRSTREIKDGTLEVFDRTFAITYILRTLAVIVSFVGVLSALMAIQLERAKEIGFLRAMGMSPKQVRRLVLIQTGFMGLIAGILALPMGLCLAWMLTFVINKRSFGWTLHFEWAPGVLLGAMILAVAAALLAGLYPAYRTSRAVPATILREE